jgi:hypothetical protein
MCSLLFMQTGAIITAQKYWGDQTKDVMGGRYDTHCGYDKCVELNASRTEATMEIRTQKRG